MAVAWVGLGWVRLGEADGALSSSSARGEAGRRATLEGADRMNAWVQWPSGTRWFSGSIVVSKAMRLSWDGWWWLAPPGMGRIALVRQRGLVLGVATFGACISKWQSAAVTPRFAAWREWVHGALELPVSGQGCSRNHLPSLNPVPGSQPTDRALPCPIKGENKGNRERRLKSASNMNPSQKKEKKPWPTVTRECPGDAAAAPAPGSACRGVWA